jgi:PAS domain S-box-containing protein
MAEHDRSSADPIENRLEFETLISDLSSRFINVPPSEVDHEIKDALRRVCELLGIDLAVLWQWSGAAPGVITPTHAYAQEGLQPLGQLRQEQFPWYVEEMLAGRMVAVSSLEELPVEAAVDRECARLLGIKSNLCLPLSVGGEPPVGALGLNTLRVQHQWPDALVKRLQLVAQVFTNALARRRHELSLQESEERLSLAADSAEAGLWVLDYRTGVFWATERARAIFGYSPDEVVSMERFEASVHPDDWDLVQGAIERSARAGEPANVEYRIILPGDGRVRWVSSRGRPRFTSTGKPER